MTPKGKSNRGKKPNPIREVKSSQHDSIPNKHFSWHMKNAELDGPFGWKKIDIATFINVVLSKLQDYESMTWGEIEGGESHFVDCEKLCRKAQKRLEEIGKGSIEDLFSLRIDGKKRIWGDRQGACLILLWWDPNHQVCPSSKK